MGMVVTIVLGDEWEAVYVDGMLKVEGAVLSPRDILNAVDIHVDTRAADPDWLLTERGTHFPPELKDVVFK